MTTELNSKQIRVLEWIRDGCPAGVMQGEGDKDRLPQLLWELETQAREEEERRIARQRYRIGTPAIFFQIDAALFAARARRDGRARNAGRAIGHDRAHRRTRRRPRPLPSLPRKRGREGRA